MNGTKEKKETKVVIGPTNGVLVRNTIEVVVPTVNNAAKLVFTFDKEGQAWEFAQGKPARGLDSVRWE